MHMNEVSFITVNNIIKPQTGGDYTYHVMRDELLKNRYKIFELSTPSLIDHFVKLRTPNLQAIYALSEIIGRFICCCSSIKKLARGRNLIITSSSPVFPVFGHLTYHQPKAGLFTQFRNENISVVKRIGYKITENEKLSPLWFFVKKCNMLHLSNSQFTRELVKKIYQVDSYVLYPPVPVNKYIHLDFSVKRKPYVLIARPNAMTGISLLPKITKYLSKDITLIIIGMIDKTGMYTLRRLKKEGVKYNYLGYVNERIKLEVLRKCSAYINLSINEPFGITIVEAMAAGCIPIAHNSGGIPEYLPYELMYSTSNEAGEKIKRYIQSGYKIRKNLRNISLEFREDVFRRKFMSLINHLENQFYGRRH